MKKCKTLKFCLKFCMRKFYLISFPLFDGCCCTVPRIENATGEIPLTVPSIAQPLRDSPPAARKNLAPTTQISYAIFSLLFAFFVQ